MAVAVAVAVDVLVGESVKVAVGGLVAVAAFVGVAVALGVFVGGRVALAVGWMSTAALAFCVTVGGLVALGAGPTVGVGLIALVAVEVDVGASVGGGSGVFDGTAAMADAAVGIAVIVWAVARGGSVLVSKATGTPWFLDVSERMTPNARANTSTPSAARATITSLPMSRRMV